MHLPRRPEQLERERPRELALADAGRPVEEVGVHRPLGDGGVEEALRLVPARYSRSNLLTYLLRDSPPALSDPSSSVTRSGKSDASCR